MCPRAFDACSGLCAVPRPFDATDNNEYGCDCTIKPPETPANCGWGDDGKTLYMTARTGLYRIKLAVPGQRLVY